MAVFAQFGADIDEETANMLKNGERLMELLKQKQDLLFPLSEQVAILLAVSNGVFKNTDKRGIDARRAALLSFLRDEARTAMRAIDETGTLSESHKELLLDAFERFTPEEGEADGQSV
jgi:F-type H+-transporting ATPase subunit alpha